MPKWVNHIILVLCCIGLIPLCMVYVTRAQRNSDTRMSIIPDMDDQQKFKAQTVNTLFADRRAMRPQVEGTVARGELQADEHFYQGIVDGNWAASVPVTNPGEPGNPSIRIDAEFMARGQERFNIYCATCHGWDGDGHGPVAVRLDEMMFESNGGLNTWVPPLSMHAEQVRSQPDGQLFNTITNGIRTMPAYGPQIDPLDRWAIVAYVRALQNSRRAGIDNVPPEYRDVLASQRPDPKQPVAEAAAESEESSESNPCTPAGDGE